MPRRLVRVVEEARQVPLRLDTNAEEVLRELAEPGVRGRPAGYLRLWYLSGRRWGSALLSPCTWTVEVPDGGKRGNSRQKTGRTLPRTLSQRWRQDSGQWPGVEVAGRDWAQGSTKPANPKPSNFQTPA